MLFMMLIMYIVKWIPKAGRAPAEGGCVDSPRPSNLTRSPLQHPFLRSADNFFLRSAIFFVRRANALVRARIIFLRCVISQVREDFYLRRDHFLPCATISLPPATISFVRPGVKSRG